MTSMTHPVHVDARLDPQGSRGLWLVKWLLALPHYVVLAFLWIAFIVLSIVAFFAILFTGRYPRSIFDFNVGVLRWHWRVAFYAYGALGTDRYPPFTLHDVPDYPAHLEVEYPARLSRGLVLVKWWLLAIPHYLVVGLLLGGAGYAVGAADDRSGLGFTGLIPLLVLVAGVVMLFTGRYPKPLFDLLLGLNRWVLRVAGYVALMTDAYPPFRLDQGGPDNTLERGDEPLSPSGPSAPSADGSTPRVAPPEPGAPGSSGTGWTSGRIVSLVLGCVLALAAMAIAIPGVALTVANETARDDAGFLMTSPESLATDTYAIVSEDLEMHVDTPPDLTPDVFLGDTRLRAEPATDNEVFVGLGPAADVSDYLAQVNHSTLLAINDGEAEMRSTEGGAPTALPTTQDFWVASASGTGAQLITWPPENGDWTVVVMNADATAGVDVDVSVGAEVPALSLVVGILLSLAGTLLVFAVPHIVLPLRAVSASRRLAPPDEARPHHPPNEKDGAS